MLNTIMSIEDRVEYLETVLLEVGDKITKLQKSIKKIKDKL